MNVYYLCGLLLCFGVGSMLTHLVWALVAMRLFKDRIQHLMDLAEYKDAIKQYQNVCTMKNEYIEKLIKENDNE